jgi:hypothetical protein
VKLAPIEGTSLHYVVNTATPIIQVSPSSWYAVQDAVWFTASSAGGPWAVATSVPTAIYTIPASSPLHYVTYVRIYETKPDTVYVGYTGGYYGSCVTNSTVVYGTGYYYPPYVGTVWYGPPATYGVGVGMTYTPWTGWTYGFGFGWSWGAVTVGWGYGAYPWWGPVGWGYYYPYPYYRPPYWGGGAAWGPWGGGAVWGPGGWAATSGNVYSRWGATSAVTRRSGLQRVDGRRPAQWRHVRNSAPATCRRASARPWATSTPATSPTEPRLVPTRAAAARSGAA